MCYPGPAKDYTACAPLLSWSSSWGSAYSYPSHSSSSYKRPQRFVDLNAADASMQVAANFTLGELMQLWKGPYGAYQVHMVEKLQQLREATGGALYINSGYRSPKYNKSVGGANYSRHMFGDAADMRSGAVSLNSLKSRCQAMGADYIGMYTNHIHCDWRHAPVEERFFGPAVNAFAARSPARPFGDSSTYAAEIITSANGVTVETSGFDEGEPVIEWFAFDNSGTLIGTHTGLEFTPPTDSASARVLVAGWLASRVELAP